MEPGLRDREYGNTMTTNANITLLQWSPVLETGNTWITVPRVAFEALLQWSPVLETGNT